VHRLHRRASSPEGALCVWWRLIVLAAALVPAMASGADAGPPACPPDRIDTRVRVVRTLDGDTVVLADGRHLRLIGMDTPEMGHDGDPNQPYAVAARDRLRRLLFTHGRHLGLRFDQERHDHYGRLLAHAFLPDGTSVSASLLRAGLATQLVVPPNIWHARCNGAAEAAARKARRGLWSLARYQAQPSTRLPATTRGYRVVRGQVIHVGHSSHALWLDLNGNFGVRIEQTDLRYFRQPLEALLGKRVEVRGYVYARRGQLRMRVRYPSALERLPQHIPGQSATRYTEPHAELRRRPGARSRCASSGDSRPGRRASRTRSTGPARWTGFGPENTATSTDRHGAAVSG